MAVSVEEVFVASSSREAEFRQFVQTRSPDLLRIAWLLTGNWQTAQDLVQTGLETTWRRRDRLVRRNAPEVYVRQVMVNTYRRWQRRCWCGEIPVAELPDCPADPPNLELRESVLAALDRLTPRQRAVLTLRFLDDQPEAEVARILGCSVGTVKAHSSQALARLRSMPVLDALLTGEQT